MASSDSSDDEHGFDDELPPNLLAVFRDLRTVVDKPKGSQHSPDRDAQMADALERLSTPGDRWISHEDFERDRRAFYALVRKAGGRYRSSGWKVGTRRLVFRGVDGNWGHIVFQSDGWRRPLPVQIFAGNLSPYLLRVYHRVNPDRPSNDMIAAHIAILWQYQFGYDEASTDRPVRFSLDERQYADPGIVLGRSTAADWLDDALAQLVPVVQALCSDRAMRDWLLENRRDRASSLHLAVLLTRHLGLDNEVPDLLALAERARADEDARAIAMGHKPVRVHRGMSYPQFWTHPRFLRFLEETEP